MFKLTALAFMPTSAVIFGILVIVILSFPSATTDFSEGAWLIYGSAALSIAISVPIAWLVARRMLNRRERRLIDAGAGTGTHIAVPPS
ncbi:hypothetical protein [Roseomonas rosulenta]|uniref:hypothetical protein n=1 Tax=Roseomonas rosulenta TaxID=2748667 RepID=UPI001E4EFBAB|nr:hypothetical protein [Roseomonas rosulenta]